MLWPSPRKILFLSENVHNIYKLRVENKCIIEQQDLDLQEGQANAKGSARLCVKRACRDLSRGPCLLPQSAPPGSGLNASACFAGRL